MSFFLHSVRLWFGQYHLDIEVGFGEEVDFPLLGRSGLFQHFKVTFDYGANPPSFEIVPIKKLKLI